MAREPLEAIVRETSEHYGERLLAIALFGSRVGWHFSAGAA